MPSYFPRQKVFQYTVDAFLLGHGIEQICVDYGFNLSKHLFPFRSSISLLKYPESFVNVSRETALERKAISALGTVSRTFSLPSVSGTSCQFFHYHVEHMLSESNQISSCSPLLRCLMTACSSFLHDAHLVAGNSNSLAIKSGQVFNFKMRVYHSACNRRPQYFRIANTILDCWQPRYFLPKCLLSKVTLRWNLNGAVICGCQKFHSSALVKRPINPICDAPFYESNAEKHRDCMTPANQNIILELVSGACYFPHPDKEETGGEDAYFICAEEQVIGVADGVGGWAALGVDAGLYARELMFHSVVAVQQEPRDSPDLLRVLEKAYSSTKAKGSSTACIITLANQEIRAINLGDSGFLIVRDGCTIFRSPVQQHDFNYTYQLESGHGSDLPSSAQVFALPVRPGDTIVAGTDGLFDNLYNADITTIVVHARRAKLNPHVAAQKIAALARQRAQDKSRQTPFSAAAQKAGYCYYGGKLDDITVVVAFVQQRILDFHFSS